MCLAEKKESQVSSLYNNNNFLCTFPFFLLHKSCMFNFKKLRFGAMKIEKSKLKNR